MKVPGSILLLLVLTASPACAFMEMFQDFLAALNPMADADTPDGGPTTPSPTQMSRFFSQRKAPTFPSPTPTASYPRRAFAFPTPMSSPYGSQASYQPLPTAGYPTYYQNTLDNPANAAPSSGKSPFIYSPAADAGGAGYFVNSVGAGRNPTDANSFLTNSPTAQPYAQSPQTGQTYPQNVQSGYPQNGYLQSGYPQSGQPSQTGYDQSGYPQTSQPYAPSGQMYSPSGQGYPQSGQGYSPSGQTTSPSTGTGALSPQEMLNYLMGLYVGLQNPSMLPLIYELYGGGPSMGSTSSGLGSGMGTGMTNGMSDPSYGGSFGNMPSGFGPASGMSGSMSGPMSLILGPGTSALQGASPRNSNMMMNPFQMAMTMHLMEKHDLI